MAQEKNSFGKYTHRGAYHWRLISRSVRQHNAMVSARYEMVLETLGDVRGQNILDIGGGDGALGYSLVREGAVVVSIDADLLGLKLACQEFTKHSRIAKVAQASAYGLPFHSCSFDSAVCADVIEHVQQPKQLLLEAARVLKPQGRLVVTTPLRATEHPQDAAHVNEFFEGDLRELMGSVFDEVTICAFAPLAWLELYLWRFGLFYRLPWFRYLFNFLTVYLGINPFRATEGFRYLSMLIATGQRR
jgi:ubiquinone/menaquinone biosynthesis C-methylase UbiE